MSLSTSLEMLRLAQAGEYAVGAFNAENMEMVQAIVTAAQEKRAPVMIQTTPSTLRYAGPEFFAGMAAAAAQRADVPICMHLDHGDSFELCMRALRAGYTSIMIDGSKLPFEENIALVRRVVDACKPCGVPVEAELGKVGGKEDDLCGEGGYTDPSEAAEFVERTGIDSLAVAIGTAHGVYKGVPRLDVERLIAVRKVVDIPLVLHGASGLSDEVVRRCVSEGICKVNYATELRQAFTGAVRQTLAADPAAFDPKGCGKAGRAAVIQAVQSRMEVCGCAGRIG